MGERERHSDFERFDHLQLVQTELERRGYFLHAVPKEHTEALVTGPLLHRLRTQIKKHGFGHVASHVAITFSGLAFDEREIYAITEVRGYWRALDQRFPELPALLATLPAFGFNGPGQVRSSKERVEFSPQASRRGGSLLGSPALPYGESQRGPQHGRNAGTTEGM
jgi:hypothetical protein